MRWRKCEVLKWGCLALCIVNAAAGRERWRETGPRMELSMGPNVAILAENWPWAEREAGSSPGIIRQQ